jgi:hypothetical protein
MAAFVQEQSEAQALVGELRITKGFLAGNEPEAKLLENGDFYWSKIRRESEREEKAAAQPAGVSWTFAWRRLMAPLSGVALIAFLSNPEHALYMALAIGEDFQRIAVAAGFPSNSLRTGLHGAVGSARPRGLTHFVGDGINAAK